MEIDSIDLPKGTSIYLEDLYLNSKSPISVNATFVYNFKIDFDTLSSNQNRFQLIFIPRVDTAGSKRNVLNNTAIASINADGIKRINEKPGLSVFPNPVTSNTIDLQMNEIAAGNYIIRLFNNSREILIDKTIKYAGGKSTQSINTFQNLFNGSYQLQVISPDKKSTTLKVIVQRK